MFEQRFEERMMKRGLFSGELGTVGYGCDGCWSWNRVIVRFMSLRVLI